MSNIARKLESAREIRVKSTKFLPSVVPIMKRGATALGVQADGALDYATASKRLLARGPYLRRYIEGNIPSYLKRELLTDDVLQDVYLHIFRAMPQYREDGPDSFERWTTTIAKRRLATMIRQFERVERAGNWPAVLRHDNGEPFYSALFDRFLSPERTPSRQMSRKEGAKAVALAMDRLPPLHREVVSLRHFEGRSIPEIAEHIGKSESATRGLLFRGMEMLERYVGDASNFLSDIRSRVDVLSDENGGRPAQQDAPDAMENRDDAGTRIGQNG